MAPETANRQSSEGTPDPEHEAAPFRYLVLKLLRSAQVWAHLHPDTKYRVQAVVRRVARVPHESDFRLFEHLTIDAPKVIDIGANRGQSINSFHLTCRRPSITAFEPNPLLVERLGGLDARVEQIHGVALSDQDGRSKLYVPVYDSQVFDGLACLDPVSAVWLNADRIIGFRPSKLKLHELDVDVLTLDSFGLSPDVVKIDVQGTEEAVVRGGWSTLRAHEPILLIEAPSTSLVTMLAEAGWRRYAFDGRRLVPNRNGETNTFFITDARLADLTPDVHPRPRSRRPDPSDTPAGGDQHGSKLDGATAESMLESGHGDGTGVAMVMTHHPKVSYAFLSRELDGLEALGLRVLPIALNSPAASDLGSEDAVRERERTLYLKAVPWWRALILVAKTSLRRPAAVAHALRLGITLCGLAPERLLRHVLHVGEAALVMEHCREHHVSVIHAHFGGTTSTVAMLASELSRRSGREVPAQSWSFTVHGLDVWNDSDTALRRKVMSASAVVCVSDFTRSQVLRVARPQDWWKVAVVRSGINIDEFTYREPRTSSVPHRLVSVGRLAPEKGHLVLLDAVAQVRERGVDVLLDIVGDGPMRPELERRAACPDLKGAVQMLGERPQSDVRRIVGQADAFCLASFTEGLPAAIVEAMALGTPVVSTSVGGIPELVVDRVSGRCVPPAHVELLADAIEDTVVDRKARRAYSRAGRAQVDDLYDIKTTSRQLADLLMQALTAEDGRA